MSDKKKKPTSIQDVVMHCFQCGEKISRKNNGICINKGTPHEIYQCDDCHYIEFGYKITGALLVF